MTPSDLQQAVIDWATNTTSGNASVIARAGTGKTTLLIELSMALSRAYMCRIFLGAFGKMAADHLKASMPKLPGIDASTFHSAGLRAWNKAYQVQPAIEKHKMRKLMGWAAVDKALLDVALELMGYAKLAGLGIVHPYEDIDRWKEIIDHHDLDAEIPQRFPREQFIVNCIMSYEDSLKACLPSGYRNSGMIDFNDMLLAPLYYRLELPKYDWVLIDEAQDTNVTRRMMAEGMMGPSSRLVAVGDEKQAIFGFAGATHDAMDVIHSRLKTEIFPLNVTYRCPKLVVNAVQEYVPDYEAHESAPDGVVRTIHHLDFWSEKFVIGQDAILCRVTAPLVGIAVRLRERGIACVVEGVGAKGLLALATRWEYLEIEDYLKELEKYQTEKEQEFDLADKAEKKAKLQDRCSTIKILCGKLRPGATTSSLVRSIEMMFGEGDRIGKLTLCTVHRAKGREWDRVFLVGKNGYMPHYLARTGWEMQQEDNLVYVAMTRAKRELAMVDVPTYRDKKTEQVRVKADWWDLDEDSDDRDDG